MKHFWCAMLRVGAKVRLLSRIGVYPAGTVAVIVSVTGYLCEIEFEGERRLTVDCNDVAPIDD